MSYYYNYYIGYRDINTDKIYPLGPYNNKGKLQSAVTRSRSFASDLYELFSPVKESQVTDELRKDFEYEEYDGTKSLNVKYVSVSKLPDESFIRSGYFLIKDVEAYEKEHDSSDLFYESLSPQVYVAKLENQMKFGYRNPENTDEYQASDYMYYMYPEYISKGCEIHVIKMVLGIMEDCSLKDVEYVVLETEG